MSELPARASIASEAQPLPRIAAQLYWLSIPPKSRSGKPASSRCTGTAWLPSSWIAVYCQQTSLRALEITRTAGLIAFPCPRWRCLPM